MKIAVETLNAKLKALQSMQEYEIGVIASYRKSTDQREEEICVLKSAIRKLEPPKE